MWRESKSYAVVTHASEINAHTWQADDKISIVPNIVVNCSTSNFRKANFWVSSVKEAMARPKREPPTAEKVFARARRKLED